MSENLEVPLFTPLTTAQQLARDGKVSPQECLFFVTESPMSQSPRVARVPVLAVIEDPITEQATGFYVMSVEDLRAPPGISASAATWFAAESVRNPQMVRIGGPNPQPMPLGSQLVKTQSGWCAMPPGYEYTPGKGFSKVEVPSPEPEPTPAQAPTPAQTHAQGKSASK